MKNRILFLIIVLMMAHLHTVFAIKSDGRDCYGTFPTSILSSKNKKIIEKFEWTDTHTFNPRIISMGYEAATIEGRIDAYQKTKGLGTVGVFPEGSVSGPNFSLTLEKEFNTNTVGEFSIVGHSDATTSMHTKNSDTNDHPGPYTLTGSAEFVGVGGGGGITILGSGFTLSGTIEFNTTKSAPSQTLTLTVKQKRPKSYECSHKNCEVELPNKHHHRIECSELLYSECASSSHHGDNPCGRVYYVCQTTTCPNSDNHKVTGGCGHVYKQKDSSKHALLATCSSCNAASVYTCSEHPENCIDGGSGSGSENNNGGGVGEDTNQYVDPGNGGVPSSNGGCTTPPANGGCTTTPTLVNCHKRYDYSCYVKVSNAYEHQTACPDCGDGYWTCNSSDMAEHRLRTCTQTSRYSSTQCGQQWRRCQQTPFQEYHNGPWVASPRCPKTNNIGFCSDAN